MKYMTFTPGEFHCVIGFEDANMAVSVNVTPAYLMELRDHINDVLKKMPLSPEYTGPKMR